MTGITREKASQVAASFLGGESRSLENLEMIFLLSTHSRGIFFRREPR